MGCPQTPKPGPTSKFVRTSRGDVEAAPKWMQLGFRLYEALKADGYRTYQPYSDAPQQVLEVHPHASYAVLLGHIPFLKDSLEGRMQRQLVLFNEGLGAPKRSGPCGGERRGPAPARQRP